MDQELADAIARRDQSRRKLEQSVDVVKKRLDRSRILFLAAADARQLFAPDDPPSGPARGPPEEGAA